MPLPHPCFPMRAEAAGHTTLVKIIDKDLDGEKMQAIARRWRRPASEPGRHRLRLDFGNVEFLTASALGHLVVLHKKAEALWDELRTGEASGEVVTEGRIVAAGARADRGDIAGAIRLLERGPVKVKKPKAHHLRLWYALADLYERAGDTPKARELFSRIVGNEPDFADAAERLAGLG